MKTNEVKSFAKINLALHVTGKLTNLHKIESVVNFIDLHDKIFIKKINSNKHNISFIQRTPAKDKLNIPKLHLDSVYWKKDWNNISKDEFHSQMNKYLVKNKSWVIDGNYSNNAHFTYRLELADIIIFLDFGTQMSLQGIHKRAATYKHLTRSSLSEYIFSRSMYNKYGFYDYPLAWNSDDRAWLDFSDNKPIYSINESIVFFRLSEYHWNY